VTSAISMLSATLGHGSEMLALVGVQANAG